MRLCARLGAAAIGAAAALIAPPALAQTFEVVDTHVWEESFAGFGGYSGLWVSPDGQDFMTVSDRGTYVTGTLDRATPSGPITGVTVTRQDTIRDLKGTNPASFLRDAEGLAIRDDGRIYISYEGHHRIWAFATMDTKPKGIHKWNRFWSLQPNSGMEALAIDKDGAIYAIPERSGKWTKPYPVFRLKDGTWDETTLSFPRRDKLLVVGADVGPDGRLYVLEREFRWYQGFTTRIRSFALGANALTDERLHFLSDPGVLGNTEGISVWTDANGTLRMTLITDDNFNPVQDTALHELAPSAPPGETG